MVTITSPLRLREAGRERGRLAEVPAQPDDPHVVAAPHAGGSARRRCRRSSRRRRRSPPTAWPSGCERRVELVDEQRDAPLLVVNGDDDGDHAREPTPSQPRRGPSGDERRPSGGRSAGLFASAANARLSSVRARRADSRRSTARAGRGACPPADGVRGLERQPPGEHPEEQYAERVDVGRRRDGQSLDLLRRDVRGGSEHGAGGGQARRAAELREPEVGDLRVTRGGEEHVRGLEVAVDDPALVSMREPGGDLAGELVGDGVGELLAVRHPFVERSARQVLEDDVRPAVRLAEGVDGADVRVRERRDRTRLALEARRVGVARRAA